MRKGILSVLTALFLVFPLVSCGGEVVVRHYRAADPSPANPLMGHAVWAEDGDSHPQPFSLVYANIPWAELEPEEGVFDFAAVEEKYRFDHWREAGVHMILRFVSDIPGEEAHSDLPAWLADKAGGAAYDVSYGRGFSPDYSNAAFRKAHRRAVFALGKRYDGDPFVSFVELGSLGHWGEWHVHPDVPAKGSMPDEAVRADYIRDYLDAFRETRLLMRRPFTLPENAEGLPVGLYNDAAGNLGETVRWLDWIASGGAYEGEAGGLSPMPEIWKTAPIGGELATSLTPEEHLTDDPGLLARLMRLSHASWIGPNSLSEVDDPSLEEALLEVSASLGYRLRVTECRVEKRGSGYRITVGMTNDGVAPFYYPWPVMIRLTDDDGSETFFDSGIDLRKLLPGGTAEGTAELPRHPGAGKIAVGITDPMTGKAAVSLAMEVEEDAFWYDLAELP